MITFGTIGLSLSPAVARALLAFSLDDATRLGLYGFGIDEGDVCATDGQAAVRFEQADIDDGANAPTRWNGRVFPRNKVEAALKARSKPNAVVVLPWTDLLPESVQFAKLSKVEPADYVRDDDLPIAWQPALLGRLEIVSRACRRDKDPGEQVAPALPAAVLTSLGGYLDPCRYTIGGQNWDTAIHTAYVTIMPMNMRARGATGDKLAQQAARERVEAKRVAEERKNAKAKVAAMAREQTAAARAEGRAVEKRNAEQREPRAKDAPADASSVNVAGELPSVSEVLAPVGGLREDDRTKQELARLSAAKLTEAWSNRDAQKQVLSNVLHGREVSREARKRIVERIAGRPLSDLRFVVAEVLGVGQVAA